MPDHGIRRHRAKEKRGTFSHGRSIDKRPHKGETRQEFCHFEADTVLSGKRKGQAVATFVERKSSLTIVKRLHGRDSQSMTQAVLELASQLQDKLKTLTVDHGLLSNVRLTKFVNGYFESTLLLRYNEDGSRLCTM